MGSSKSLYYVHPGGLSSCKSSALRAWVNGPWKENGASGPIDWTDFDEQTVECVLRYLYTGDYCAGGPLSGQEKVIKLSGNRDDNEGRTNMAAILINLADRPDGNGMPVLLYCLFG